MAFLRYLLFASLLLAGPAKANTFDVSLYGGEFPGYMVGSTIGDRWLAQINLVGSENLGGLSLAAGHQFNRFSVFVGGVFSSSLESVRRSIDVNGVQVEGQDTPEFSHPPLFLEIQHDSGWFVRYAEYKAEYTIDARRFTTTQRFDASENFKIEDSVWMVGLRWHF